MKKQDKETPYNEFVELVKKSQGVYAELSHENPKPYISKWAILFWRWDDNKEVLFSILRNGERVECSLQMPAFHVYDLA